jgi:hypothetical protein
MKPSVCEKSVTRFAQDDGFVWGLEIQLVGYAENAQRSKKSQAPSEAGFPTSRLSAETTYVVLFMENHISGLGDGCVAGNPGTLGMTKERAMVP